MRRGLGVLLAAALTMPVGLQSQQGWTVKPEWVRAHEEFLASDVMAGRGSATRDEEIAATYVASEFMAYGLKPAPGMAGYLQGAEVDAPVLDGKAVLSVSSIKLIEGKDFQLLVSTGANVSGGLVRVTDAAVGKIAPAKGTALLLTDVLAGANSMQHAGGLRRFASAMILVQEDEFTDRTMTMYGGKTRVPMRLKGAERQGNGTTFVILKRAAMERLKAVRDGEMLALTLGIVPQVKPRMTFNVVGYLPGVEAGSGTILLTAHLDHLGVGQPVDGDGIYNGANDDAAGTTAVLELAHALAAGPRLRRSVLFVCYGSEEAGELGSEFFGKHPPVPLKEIVTNLEFEMIGSQDPKMPKGDLLFTGWERSNLGPTLKAHGAKLGPDPYPEEHFFERSDNYQLALQGIVAHTAAGWGTVPTYHLPNDDLAHLNLEFMTSAIQSLVEPVRWLASSDFKPAWNPGGMPKR